MSSRNSGFFKPLIYKILYLLQLRSNSLCLFAGLALLWGCKSEPTQGTQQVAAPTASAAVPTLPTTAPATPTALPALVDIPTLLRLPITQVRKRLGKPADERQADVYNSEHMLVYKLKGKELIVDYIVKTGQVLEVALDVKHDVTDYTALYALGQLNRQDTSYVVTPLLSSESKHEGKCRGIIVSPHPPIEYPAN